MTKKRRDYVPGIITIAFLAIIVTLAAVNKVHPIEGNLTEILVSLWTAYAGWITIGAGALTLLQWRRNNLEGLFFWGLILVGSLVLLGARWFSLS